MTEGRSPSVLTYSEGLVLRSAGARPLGVEGRARRSERLGSQSRGRAATWERPPRVRNPFVGRGALLEEAYRGETLRVKGCFMERAVSRVPVNF